MPSATLLPEDKVIIRNAIGHTCQIFTATIVRLYLASADPSQWSYTRLMGAVALLKDTRKNDAFFLRIVELKSGTVAWEQELYRGFDYTLERPFFHTFPTDTCMAGLSFADEHEAVAFYNKVQNRDNLRIQPRTSQVSSTSSMPRLPSSTNVTSLSGGDPPATSSSTGGLFSSRRGSKGAGPGGKKKFDKSLIGTPTNFRHLTHIGWDPEKGFSTINIPPEWKRVFDQAGVTEEQLQDKKTAKFIFDFMAKHADTTESPPPAGSAPPPPVSVPMPMDTPGGSRRAPPPPPPPSRSATRPVPPPPPSRALAPPPPPPSRPPTTASSAPPPPPMPPMSNTDTTAIIPPRGSTAKPTPTAPGPPDTRNALLESIRSGGVGVLKPVSREDRERDAAASGSSSAAGSQGDIASALRMALTTRKAAVGGGGAMSESEGDGEDDDDEW